MKEADGKINVALVGAGEFAKAMHLPNLKKLSSLYHLRAVVSRSGSNAKDTAERFNADYCTTKLEDVLADDSVDMVLIATRHHLHARQAILAARSGKAIYVEKPMALNEEELEELVSVLKETEVPFTVGFNRRFSPAARRAKEILEARTGPLMMLYRVNAGYTPRDHWIHSEEGGGRIIGEACHMFDFFNCIVGFADVVEVYTEVLIPNTEHLPISENVVASVRYGDGSVCTLIYTSLGAQAFPKEYVEIYADGKTLVIDDYRELGVYGAKMKGWRSSVQDKGHLEELRTFAKYVRKHTDPAISLKELVMATRVSFQVNARGNKR